MVLLISVFCVLIFAVPGYFMLTLGIKSWRTVQRVEREGVVTRGRVENVREEVNNYYDSSGSSRTTRSYYATVSYEAEGRFYSHELVISRDHYRTWEKNRLISVQYLPSEPQKSFLLEDRSTQKMAPWMIFGGVFLLICAVILLVVIIVYGARGTLG